MISTSYLFETDQIIAEGVIRGLLTIPYRNFKQMAVQITQLRALIKDPLTKVKIIETELDKIKDNFSKMNIDLSDSNHSFLKALDTLVFWRYYVILNDKVYKECLNDIIVNNDTKNIWVDVNFKERQIPIIYNIKTNKDIVKILDIYKKRINEIYTLSKKHPEKAKLYNKLLIFGLNGLLDLFVTLHSVVSYGSKGL